METEKKVALANAMRRIKNRSFMLEKLRMLEAPESMIQQSEMLIDKAKKEYAALLDDKPAPDNIGSVIYNADILSWSRQFIEECLEHDQCEALFQQIMDQTAELLEKLIASKGLSEEWHRVNDEQDYDRVFEIRALIDQEFGVARLSGLIIQWRATMIDNLAHYLCFHASWHK